MREQRVLHFLRVGLFILVLLLSTDVLFEVCFDRVGGKMRMIGLTSITIYKSFRGCVWVNRGENKIHIFS
jgi:hypothetical protein